jgi:hypothetical protein
MDYKTGNAELDKELDERFAILSPTVRQLMSGDSISNMAHDFAVRYNLDDEAEAGIANEIMLVLMYLEPVEDFGGILMSEYLIAPEIALDIEKEAGEKIFSPLRSELGSIKDLPPETAEVENGVPLPPTAALEVTPITSLPSIPAPVSAPTPAPATPIPPPPTPTTLAASRVMPKNDTELPGALLQNLKASLAHDAVGTAYGDEQVPKPSYGAILDNGTGK